MRYNFTYLSCICVFFCAFSYQSFAQTYKVSGTLLSEELDSLDFVYIDVLQEDSILITHVISDSLGNFSFSVQRGVYICQFKYAGIEICQRKIIVIDCDIDIGTVTIDTPKVLSDIFITAKKPLIERKIDRLVFNVEQSIQATGGTALDVLKATPMIIVKNNTISMIGKGKVNIFINDRMLPYPEEDVADFLRSIFSDEILRIEVLTTPPAKYDSEKNSGIVNIVLKKDVQQGLYAAIRTSWIQASAGYTHPSTILKYKTEQWLFVMKATYNYGSQLEYREHNIYYPNRFFRSNNNTAHKEYTFDGTISVEHKLNHQITLGGAYSLNNSHPYTINISGKSSIHNILNGSIDSSLTNEFYSKSIEPMHIANVYSTIYLDHIFDGKKIDINVDYAQKNMTENNYLLSNSYFANGNIKPASFFKAHTINNLNYNILTAKTDLYLPSKFFLIETGIKTAFIETNTNCLFYDQSLGFSILDKSKTNRFRYSEHIHAAYVSVSTSLRNKVQIKIGGRGEYTNTLGYSPTNNDRTMRHYFQLLPTSFVDYSLSDHASINLAYSKRIDRPTYSTLNPFKYYTSSYAYEEGNIFLQAFYTDVAEMNFTYKNSYTQFFINSVQNATEWITFVDLINNIQRSTTANMYDQLTYGIYYMYDFSLFHNKLHNNSSISAFYTQSKSKDFTLLPNIKSWGLQLTTLFTYSFDSDSKWSAEIGFNYYSPTTQGLYKTTAWYELNAAIRVKLLKNEPLTISLNAYDILRTSMTTFSHTLNNIQQNQRIYEDTQSIRLSISYMLGNNMTIRNKEISNNEEIERIGK